MNSELRIGKEEEGDGGVEVRIKSTTEGTDVHGKEEGSGDVGWIDFFGVPGGVDGAGVFCAGGGVSGAETVGTFWGGLGLGAIGRFIAGGGSFLSV